MSATIPFLIMSEIASRERGAREPALVEEICERILVRGEVWRRQFPHNLASVSSREEVIAYLEYCEQMLFAVEREGKSVFEVPVAVALGPKGRVYKIGDGRHRLAACQAVGTGVNLEFRNVHMEVLKEMLADGRQSADVVLGQAFADAVVGRVGC